MTNPEVRMTNDTGTFGLGWAPFVYSALSVPYPRSPRVPRFSLLLSASIGILRDTLLCYVCKGTGGGLCLPAPTNALWQEIDR